MTKRNRPVINWCLRSYMPRMSIEDTSAGSWCSVFYWLPPLYWVLAASYLSVLHVHVYKNLNILQCNNLPALQVLGEIPVSFLIQPTEQNNLKPCFTKVQIQGHLKMFLTHLAAELHIRSYEYPASPVTRVTKLFHTLHFFHGFGESPTGRLTL